jgi:phosphocarrier protein
VITVVEKIARIKSKYGIHARPAAAICSTAKKYPDAKILIVDPRKEKEEIDAKSILTLMTLNKKCGDELIVKAYGIDEDKAADDVANTINEFEIRE